MIQTLEERLTSIYFESLIDQLDAIITIQRVFSILDSEGEFLLNKEKDQINYTIISYLMDDLRGYLMEKYRRQKDWLDEEKIRLKTGGNE